jgi:hypothetical protein
MEVRDWVIDVAGGAADTTPPSARTYPEPGAARVYRDAVVKAFFSEPVRGVTPETFTLTNAAGLSVPAFVDQIGDGAWGLFPHQVFLEPGAAYTARLAPGICDTHGNCTTRETVWRFTVAAEGEQPQGDTGLPRGFPAAAPPAADLAPAVATVARDRQGRLAVAFTEPVMNVGPLTLRVAREGAQGCASPGQPVPGKLSSSPTGATWTFTPAQALPEGAGLCVTASTGIYDLAGQPLARPYRGRVGR